MDGWVDGHSTEINTYAREMPCIQSDHTACDKEESPAYAAAALQRGKLFC